MLRRPLLHAAALCFAGSAIAVCAAAPPATPTGQAKGTAVKLPGSGAVAVKSADIVIIPMRGQVGQSATTNEWIDAVALEALFKQAKSLRPKFVVLDIESPGGFVSVMHQIGELFMHEFPKDGTAPQLVAWPGMAGSAASYFTLACPTIVAKPTARVGAALTIVPTTRGWVAIDDLGVSGSGYVQKMKSFSDATDRIAMAYGGHPLEVRLAMASQEAELWWSPSQRQFAAHQPPAKPRTPNDYVCIDDSRSVLTLTGAEMVTYGVASAEAATAAQLPAALGLPASAQVVEIGKEMPEWFAAVRSSIDAVAAKTPEFENLLAAYAGALREIPRIEKEIDAVRVRKHGYKDGDRSRDPLLAKEKVLTDRLAAAKRSAGKASIEMTKLLVAAKAAEEELTALKAQLQETPVGIARATELSTSIALFRKNDPAGPLAALNAATKPGATKARTR